MFVCTVATTGTYYRVTGGRYDPLDEENVKLFPLVRGTGAIDHYTLHVCLKWAGLSEE